MGKRWVWGRAIDGFGVLESVSEIEGSGREKVNRGSGFWEVETVPL